MRVTREQFQQNREKILGAAGRLFRERGLEAVSVADVMKAAGLTHGGFYGHFKSKDDLIAQASATSNGAAEAWAELASTKGSEALKAMQDMYLSEGHCRSPGDGCLIAALGPELARAGPDSRAAVTATAKRFIGIMQSAAPGETEAERRQCAMTAYAAWIGAVVLARASDDEAFAAEVLDAVRAGTA